MRISELQRQITYVVIDTDSHVLGLRALQQSLEVLPVGEVLIYSDDPARWGHFAGQVRRIPVLRGLEDYQELSVRRLAEDVRTAYCIVLQWDGFALNRDEFQTLFRHYDYIGAAWPQFREFNVGNSGFNWRSRAFLEASARLADQRETDEADDLFLCRRMRVTLETRFRLRFAPEAIADHFSVESRTVQWPSFGFHGVPHLPAVYRHELPFLIEHFPRRAVARWHQKVARRIREYGDDEAVRLWDARCDSADPMIAAPASPSIDSTLRKSPQ